MPRTLELWEPTTEQTNTPEGTSTDTQAGTSTDAPVGNRDRILDYLRTHGPSTTPAISRGLGGPTSPIVRKHLNRARLDGLVEQTGLKWDLSFAGLSSLPGGPTEEASTMAAVAAELDFVGKVAQARKLVADSLALLGRASMDSLEARGLRAQLTTADRRLADATPRDFDGVCGAVAPIVEAAQRRRAMRGEPVTTGRGRSALPTGPLRDLVERKGQPAKVFIRGGWVTEVPVEGMRFDPPLGRRYRSTITGCAGVVVWDRSTWSDPEVDALRLAVLAVELPSPALTIGRP